MKWSLVAGAKRGIMLTPECPEDEKALKRVFRDDEVALIEKLGIFDKENKAFRDAVFCLPMTMDAVERKLAHGKEKEQAGKAAR